MTMFIQNDATGGGAGSLDATQAFVDLTVDANGDTGLGLAAQVGNRQQVTYARTDSGVPAVRLDNLINTNFSPDYGAGPQAVIIVVLPVLANFTLNDGTMITNIAGTALPPNNSGLPGAGLNTTNDCLVIYDTSQSNGNGYCTARAGTGGTLDLAFPNPVLLYHELSHAFRIVNDNLLALSLSCNPSSPEENAAITDENDVRTQIANALGTTPVLRDPGIHCGNAGPCASGGGGGCCIVATVASGSAFSDEVAALRSVRDGLLRKTEVGFSFFQSLYHDYYGFSPQVCTLMTQYPELRPLVLEGFVRPLVCILRLIEQYAIHGGTAATLGKQFVDDHNDREAAATRLGILFQARQLLSGTPVELSDTQIELAHMLLPALSSEHVKWALVEPIRIYESALHAHLDGCTAEHLSKQLYQAIDDWAGQFPLDDVWASLAVEELENEFKALDSTLLRTEEARTSFRDRLKREFPLITAVATVVNRQTPGSGENQ